MLTERRQHGHSNDKECNKSIEDFDCQLQRAALLAPHTTTSAAATCKNMEHINTSCTEYKYFPVHVDRRFDIVRFFWSWLFALLSCYKYQKDAVWYKNSLQDSLTLSCHDRWASTCKWSPSDDQTLSFVHGYTVTCIWCKKKFYFFYMCIFFVIHCNLRFPHHIVQKFWFLTFVSLLLLRVSNAIIFILVKLTSTNLKLKH